MPCGAGVESRGLFGKKRACQWNVRAVFAMSGPDSGARHFTIFEIAAVSSRPGMRIAKITWNEKGDISGDISEVLVTNGHIPPSSSHRKFFI